MNDAAKPLAGLLSQLTPEKRALLAELLRPPPEPVAIVGIACRAPGGADDPEALWRLLVDGVDAVGEVPRERWDPDAWADPRSPEPAHRSLRWGGFIRQRVDGFDAPLFGVSPREAAATDPQHRLLLEATWEALESAAIAPESLAGARGGVFFGIYNADYAQLQDLADAGSADAYSAIGTGGSFAAGRVAYLLDLRGPAVAVDTVCSSSLVAVHLACQSLRARECDVALAGGVSLMLSPLSTYVTAQLGALSPDGRCRAFDARANGFVRGEGCGVLALRRLSDAQAAGDPIWAVIRGSAVGQDGRGAGLTAPNGRAQEAVIRDALKAAGVEAAAVGYVEAHGTGTPLGDPIELEALRAVYGAGERPCLVGSIKTNLGHLEAAAGVIGLIKAALVVARGQVPPHLHFRSLSPRCSLAGSRLKIAAEGAAWPEGPRIAAVSSFGMSGTNAHAIVEAPPPATAATTATAGPRVLPLAARDEAALRALAGRWAEALAELPAAAWPAACATACRGRRALPVRAAVVADGPRRASELLRAAAAGEAGEGLVRGEADRERPPRVGMLFSGQGAQYVGMGAALMAWQPAFREALQACAAALDPHLPRPLLAVMHGDAAALDETQYTQPALFALQVALAAMWRAWGVAPAAVLGHSVGSIAAACVAGALTLPDAARLVAERARRMQALPRGGGMLAVFADEAEVAAAIAGREDALGIAALNAPREVVISGELGALTAVQEALAAAGVRTRALRVSHAFHSPRVEPVLAPLAAAIAGLPTATPRVPMISDVTGAPAETLDAAYWVRHVRAPVRFCEGVRALAASGCDVLLEVGPGAQLLGLAAACLPAELPSLPSLRHGRDERAQALQSLAGLQVRGLPVAWDAVDPERPRRRSGLPLYPFQRARHWRGRTDLPGLAPATDPADAWSYAIAWREAPLPGPEGHVPEDREAGATGGEGDGRHVPEDMSMAAACGTAGPGGHVPEDMSMAASCGTAGPGGHVLEDRSMEARRGGAGPGGHVLEDRSMAAPRGGAGPGGHVLEDMSGDGAVAVVGGGEVGEALARALRGRGRRAAWVAEVDGIAGAPAGVVLLTALAVEEAPAPAEVAAAQRGLVLPALAVMRRLVGRGAARLWVCTRGAVAVAADEAPAVMQAPLRALAGSAAFEHPELACVRVDLDPRGDAVAALVREIEAADGEDEVAWRGGRRLAPRLRAAAPGRATAPAIRGDATYLVTGGLRGLGLAVAGWLVGRGARHLALLGRSAPDAAAAAEISAWTAAGVQVHVRAVDVGDAEALAATLAGLEAAAPPLAGVFHAAGVVADATLLRQDWDRCWTVMAPKLVGAWTLDRATRGRPLDCFVLFSSMAAVTGAPGQANYAAANAFLDALAARRRAAGLAATSVGWGPWAEIGMAADAPARARPGLDPLTPAEGLRALERAVAGGAAHVVVVKARWPEFLAGAPARPRVFADLAPETGSAPADARAEVLALAGEARRERALEHVRAAVAAALGSAPAAVPARAPLRDLGMDSLMAVQIRNAINGAFALQLPATLLFEQPTAAALCDCVLAALVGEAPAAASAPVHDRAAEVEEMSEDEVEALLLARLRTLEAPEG